MKNNTTLLRKGITGFNIPAFSFEEVRTFRKTISYPFIPDGEIESPHHSSNYFRQGIKNLKNGESFDLLIHQSFWIIAAVKKESAWMELQFIDLDEAFINQIHAVHIQILDSRMANTVVPAEELQRLGDYEIKQVKYWNSKKYGEIIFNGYD